MPKSLSDSIAVGSVVRLLALASQFLVLVVMAWILPKEDFGDAMIAFGIFRLVSMGLGTGIGNLLLYRVSRKAQDELYELKWSRTLTLVAIIIAVPLSALITLNADLIAVMFRKPGLAAWLVQLSPMLLFGTLNLVAAGSLDGRSKVTESIFTYEFLPNALRLVAFLAIAIWSLPLPFVAVALWASMGLPWLAEGARLSRKIASGLSPISFWDCRYAALMGVNTWAGQHLQGIDIVVVGFLFSSELSADYAMAIRFASLFPFFQFMLVRNFAPRLGALLEVGDLGRVNAELHELRTRTVLSVAGTTAGVLLFAPIALLALGSFDSALRVTIALAIPALFRSAFGGTDVVMRMTGRPGAAATASLFGLMIISVFPYFAANYMGIYSMPFAMCVYAILINVVLSIISLRDGIKVHGRAETLAVLTGCGFLLGALFVPTWWASLGVSIVGLLLVLVASWLEISKQKARA